VTADSSQIVADPEDIIDIDGLRPPRGREATGARRPFLSIWFRCCHAYGRLYRNRAETAYEGRCPKCSRPVVVQIGPGGTGQRFFTAR
jgi:hypothetical protein